MINAYSGVQILDKGQFSRNGQNRREAGTFCCVSCTGSRQKFNLT